MFQYYIWFHPHPSSHYYKFCSAKGPWRRLASAMMLLRIIKWTMMTFSLSPQRILHRICKNEEGFVSQIIRFLVINHDFLTISRTSRTVKAKAAAAAAAASVFSFKSDERAEKRKEVVIWKPCHHIKKIYSI